MASIANNAYFLQNATVQIGTDNFEEAISSITLTPSSSQVTFKGLTPAAIQNFSTPSTWVAALEFAQDWTTTGSLSQYLFAHEGQAVTMTFVPEADDLESPTITATVVIVPGSIGGAGGAVATSQVSLPVNGKPTITPAA